MSETKEVSTDKQEKVFELLANVLEQAQNYDKPEKKKIVDITVEVNGQEDLAKIVSILAEKGYNNVVQVEYSNRSRYH